MSSATTSTIPTARTKRTGSSGKPPNSICGLSLRDGVSGSGFDGRTAKYFPGVECQAEDFLVVGLPAANRLAAGSLAFFVTILLPTEPKSTDQAFAVSCCRSRRQRY